MNLRLAILSLGLITAPPVAAQTATPVPAHEADLACLAGMAAIAASDEDEVQQAGIYGTIFFMGKLLGHDPAFDLDMRLGAFDTTLITPALQTACLAEVQAVADRMLSFGTGEAR